MFKESELDPNVSPSFDYNIGLMVSELERRFILFLIGGDYEKMFYTLTGGPELDDVGGNQQRLGRVRLEVEISEAEKRDKIRNKTSDPNYKGMLDFILTQRLKSHLESSEELIYNIPELIDVLPFLAKMPQDMKVSTKVISQLANIPWITPQIKKLLNNEQLKNVMQFADGANLQARIAKISYPQLIWILPICLAQEIQERIHPSLLETYKKVRFYGRVMGGAIGLLVKDCDKVSVAKWKLYALGSLSCIAMVALLCLVSDATKELISQQKINLKEPEKHVDKFSVLEKYAFSQDGLREILQLEDIIKPSILDSIKIEGLDPTQYISGFADEKSPESLAFQQARAYAFYRQLYRTGRIQKHEASLFLRRYKIDKKTLTKLNSIELASIGNHVQIFKDLS